MIDQHKAEPSSSVPPSPKNVADAVTPKPEPQPTPFNPGSQKEAAAKIAVGGAVVKEESAATAGVRTKTATENVVTGKKKPGVTGGGSSLANLWGKAPAKVKDPTPPEPALVTGKFYLLVVVVA